MVENEYLLANDLTDALRWGLMCSAPLPSVQQTLALIAGETRIDTALLDVNLRGEMTFPIADALADRNIPFVFGTGYD